uniref:Uncharacterized protein n=1 Tax=Pipistrellus kuhlii TaxID=59472 RepID=A0A7J7YN75_PIPKU|nr:hypothetical protein mPipKuh1_010113 [Pipistrellus kuhlii]
MVLIISIVVDVTLITWLRSCLSDFSTRKLLLFLFSLLHSLEGSHSHLSGKLWFISLRVEYLYKLFGIPLHGILDLSSFPIIYIFSHYISKDLWIFTFTLSNNLIIFYLFFLLKIFPVLAIGDSLHSFPYSSNIASLLWINFLSLSLFSSTTRCSRLIFHIFCPNLYWRMVSETRF